MGIVFGLGEIECILKKEGKQMYPNIEKTQNQIDSFRFDTIFFYPKYQVCKMVKWCSGITFIMTSVCVSEILFAGREDFHLRLKIGFQLFQKLDIKNLICAQIVYFVLEFYNTVLINICNAAIGME